MQCDAVRQQLACYRELTEGEREAVQRHLDSCPVCMAVWEQYQAQDRALASLPDLVPSRDWAAQVRARTMDKPRPQRGRRRLAMNLAIMSLALVVALGGTVGVSAQALPGSQLYPVKRVVEQARLNLTIGEENRESYREQLAENRREEAVAVAQREDAQPVQVAFQGTLTGVSENTWIVDGVEVAVAPEIATAGTTLIGQKVGVDAEAGGGIIAASAVYVQPTPTLHVTAPSVTVAPTQAPTSAPSNTPVGQTTEEPSLENASATSTALASVSAGGTPTTPTVAGIKDVEATASPVASPRPTRDSVFVAPGHSPTATVDPIRMATAEAPSPTATLWSVPVATDAPTAIPTPAYTRVATPRITRVVPTTQAYELTPTVDLTWVATKSPTEAGTLVPTMAPTIDATPTVWTKPIVPTPDHTEVPPTATINQPPSAIPDTATPRPQTPTPKWTATRKPTTVPTETVPPVDTPSPNDIPTSTPKPPTSTPDDTQSQPTPTQAPNSNAPPRPTLSPEFHRIPYLPPTPMPTMVPTSPYPHR